MQVDVGKRHRVVPLIFAILVLDGIVGSLVFPVLPDFVANTRYPSLFFGLSTFLFSLTQFLFAPVLGQLSDQRGRRLVFRLAAVGTALSMLALLPVSVPLLMVNRLSDGATNGLYAVVKSAIVDVSPEEDVQRNVGLSTSLSYVGFLFGPGLALGVLELARFMSWNATRSLVIAGLLFALINVVLSFLVPETRAVDMTSEMTSERTLAQPRLHVNNLLRQASPLLLARTLSTFRRTRPAVFALLCVHACVVFSIAYYSYFVIFAAESPIALDGRGIAIVFLYFALLGVVANTLFFGKILSRIAPVPTMCVLLAIGSLAVLGYGLFGGQSVPALYVILTIDMLTLSLVPALIEGLLGRMAGEDERGELFGIAQGVGSLMGVVGAAVATVLSVIDLRLPFVAFSFVVGIALVLTLRSAALFTESATTGAVDS